MKKWKCIVFSERSRCPENFVAGSRAPRRHCALPFGHPVAAAVLRVPWSAIKLSGPLLRWAFVSNKTRPNSKKVAGLNPYRDDSRVAGCLNCPQRPTVLFVFLYFLTSWPGNVPLRARAVITTHDRSWSQSRCKHILHRNSSYLKATTDENLLQMSRHLA